MAFQNSGFFKILVYSDRRDFVLNQETQCQAVPQEWLHSSCIPFSKSSPISNSEYSVRRLQVTL